MPRNISSSTTPTRIPGTFRHNMLHTGNHRNGTARMHASCPPKALSPAWLHFWQIFRNPFPAFSRSCFRIHPGVLCHFHITLLQSGHLTLLPGEKPFVPELHGPVWNSMKPWGHPTWTRVRQASAHHRNPQPTGICWKPSHPPKWNPYKCLFGHPSIWPVRLFYRSDNPRSPSQKPRQEVC